MFFVFTLDVEHEVSTVLQMPVPNFMHELVQYYLLTKTVINTFEQVRRTVTEEVNNTLI